MNYTRDYWLAHPFTVYVWKREPRDFKTFTDALAYAADCLHLDCTVQIWHDPSNTLVTL